MPDDAGRSIGTPRNGISRGGVITQAGIGRNLAPSGITRGTVSTGRAVLDSGAIPPPPMSDAEIARISELARQNASQYIDVPYRTIPGSQATTTTPSAPTSFYGNADPYAVLADVFRNVFGSGGDTGRQQQTGQALVPVTSTSGGGNTFIILLVVAGIAGLAYYLYKRSKSE